jgi:hypothetical protein
LPKDADLNQFKFDYYISYEIDLNDKYSIEPSVGYTECTFKVNNEEKINEHFNFNSTKGLLVGFTINKYIPFDNYKYAVLFGRFNYGVVDYADIHSEIEGGYFEFCIGISYKFYWRDRVYNIVNKFNGK